MRPLQHGFPGDEEVDDDDDDDLESCSMIRLFGWLPLKKKKKPTV